LTKHLSAVIPNVQVHNNNVTDDMAGVLRTTMAKLPDERPKSMSDLTKLMGAMRIFRTTPKRESSPKE
jgi:hypothetical protein